MKKRSHKARVLMGSVGILLTGIQGCSFGPQSIESLNQIQEYPKTVTVEGIVGDRIPLVGQYVYELTDGSGSIWVQAADAPPEGSSLRLEVKGELQRLPMTDLGANYGELFIQELSHQAIVE